MQHNLLDLLAETTSSPGSVTDRAASPSARVRYSQEVYGWYGGQMGYADAALANLHPFWDGEQTGG